MLITELEYFVTMAPKESGTKFDIMLRRVATFLLLLVFSSNIVASIPVCPSNCSWVAQRLPCYCYDNSYESGSRDQVAGRRPWFVLFYYGRMTNDTLGQVLTFNYTLDKASLYSLEIGKELHPCNLFRRYLQPVVSTVDIRANFTVLDDTRGTIYEFNPYFALNWNQFIWCRYLKTTATFGEGMSYVTKVPFAESYNSDQERKLLNFLLFELAFALPQCPNFEVIARVHHRSGAFGLYHANNAGSTAIGIALRYRF